jgi:hypothetical protein
MRDPDITHDPTGCVTWHWHDADWGVFVSVDLGGQAAYAVRDAWNRYMDTLTLFDAADGLPLHAREAILSHDGDPSLVFVVPTEMRQ